MTQPTATRRELLAAFLGLPFALTGCGDDPAEELPEGEIVGPSVDLGHRLRGGFHPTVSGNQWQNKPVVIVGGGVAGLGAAWRLKRAKFDDFVLLEMESKTGGTSRNGTSPIVKYPWGAHYVPLPLKDNQLLIRLLNEMGALDGVDEEGHPKGAEQYLCREPQERIFYRGRWYSGLTPGFAITEEDRRQHDRFVSQYSKWIAPERDAPRAFRIPVAKCPDGPEMKVLDQITMLEWLDENNYTSPWLRWLINYACRDDYGTTLEQTSAWAALFYFASRKRTDRKEAQPVLTWPEGNGRLVAHLHQIIKSQVKNNFAVTNVSPRETGVDVTAYQPQMKQAIGYHADQVIFAAPQFLTKYLIEPWRVNPPDYLSDFTYGSWLVANLHLKDRPKSQGYPLSWDNVLYESPSLGYVVATHQALRDHGPTIFTWYYPMTDSDPTKARRRMLSMDWQSCAEVALTDLQRAHPDIRSLVTRLDVMRWGHAMIRPTPGFIWGKARREAAKPYRGIHFANTDLSGIALFEEAFYHGVRAAEEVLTARGIESPSML